ncbi:MAG: DNA alkylation repair protein [Planctomycetes bacterium]|nr:DNA alkylation repair protein [Planctomycetota bacterium]
MPAKKVPAARLTCAEVMKELEKLGSAATRKVYAKHCAGEPTFGVQFGQLKGLLKRIGVDHELALLLWESGNFDARNLAMKIADPTRATAAELDRFAAADRGRMCGGYAAMLAAEGRHGQALAKKWLAAKDAPRRASGWLLVGQLATHDESLADEWFLAHLATIEKAIHAAPNALREPMNMAVIQIGGRNAALRKAATAAAKRIGKVEVDHGDTACKTPDAVEYIDKTWERAGTKFASPAAQERAREPQRLRC